MADLIQGVILSGGRGSRMGGVDKGTQIVDGKMLVEHAIDWLEPQVDQLIISANRNIDSYRALGFPVISDQLADYQGPLAGVMVALKASESPLLAIMPCDGGRRLPNDLIKTLMRSLDQMRSEISVVHDGLRQQSLYAVLRCELANDLQQFLASGGRSVREWYARHRCCQVDFSGYTPGFRNMNRKEDLFS